MCIYQWQGPRYTYPGLSLLTGKIDKPFTCAGSGACTSLRSESIDYVGCCYRAGYCDIYTACYDGGTTVGTKTNNPRILSWYYSTVALILGIDTLTLLLVLGPDPSALLCYGHMSPRLHICVLISPVP